jgi:uncharacterized protein (DUF924 family)
MAMMMPNTVLDFWFREIDPKQWWIKDAAFDQLIRDRFAALHAQANACELFSWRATADGRLTEIIVLDQFSRNMFRDTPAAFASDPLALALAQEAVNVGADLSLRALYRPFMYMPYMHSESLAIHDSAVELFARCERDETRDSEKRHRAIIERFGRYPHRNAILGRESTVEEIAFLAQPGSSF